MAVTPSSHNGGSPAVGSVLSQHTRAESGCEMNDRGDQNSEDGEERDGGRSKTARNAAEMGVVDRN